MSATLLLRIGTQDDVEDLSGLLNASYRPSADGIECVAYSADYISELLQDECRFCFVFDNLGKLDKPIALLGCIIVLLDAKDGKTLKVEMTAVHPDAQNQGFGGSMLAAMEEFAALHLRQGVVKMDVAADQPQLIAYYRKRGYRDDGTRHFADGIETVVLQKNIRRSAACTDEEDD